MKQLYIFKSFLLVGMLSLLAGSATAQTDVTDVLTAEDFTAAGTTYTDFSGVEKNSGAVYAGQSAQDANGNIQLRSKNSNSGIVSTTSGGKLKSISITVSNGENQIDVYGNNSAYTGAADLYATGENTNQGTLLGSLTRTGTITVTGDYAYVGIRSKNGAVYLSKVEVTWESAGTTPGDTRQATFLTFPQESFLFDLNSMEALDFEGQEAELRDATGALINDAEIEYSFESSPAEMLEPWYYSYYLTLDATLTGTATVTATFAGDNQYKPSTASYTISIQKPCANIAAFNALEAGKTSKLQLSKAEVVYAKGNDIFVRDASGAIDFFKTSLGYTAGNILTGTLVATHDVYKGMNELTNPTNVDVEVTTAAEAPKARETTVAEASQYTCDLVTLNNVQVILENEKYYATDGTNRLQLYDKFRLENYSMQEGLYNITGIVIPFDNIFEICPTVLPEPIAAVVEVPVISPEGGEITTETLISITVQNPDLNIYYTLDGSEPQAEGSIAYTDPFTVDNAGEVTVTAIAVDEDGNVSESVSAVYTVLPVVVIPTPVFTPESGELKVGDKIQITWKDGEGQATLYYTLDGSDPTTPGLVPESLTLEGETPVEIIVNEAMFNDNGVMELKGFLTAISGIYANQTTEVFAYTYTLKSIPEIAAPTITPNGGEILENASINIEWNGNGGAYIYYTTDGSDPKESQTAIRKLMGVTLNVADIAPEGTDEVTIKAYAKGVAQMGTEGESPVVTATFTVIRNTNPQQGEEIEVAIPQPFGYTTLYYSDKNLIVPPTVKAYTMTIDDAGNLEKGYEYAEGEVIVARTGVVVEAKESLSDTRSRVNRAGDNELVETVIFMTTEDDSYDPSVFVENFLRGSDDEELTKGDDPDVAYYFYKLMEDEQTGKKGFFWGADNGEAFMNEPHRAYLVVPQEKDADVRGLTLDGEKISPFTGIRDFNIDGTSATVYDLQGRRVVSPARGGLYIINGKKVLR